MTNGSPVVVSQSQEEEVDRSLWKLLLLVLVTMVLSTGTVYYFNQFLLTGRSGQLLWSALIGGFFLAFAVLDSLFVKSGKRLQAIMILAVLAPLGLFSDKLYPNPSRALLVGAVIFFVFLSLATSRGHKLLGISLKIRFSEIAKTVVPKATTGLFIFLSIFLYLQYFEWGKFDEKVGRNFVFQSLSASEPIVRIFYPNFSFDQSIGKLLSIVAEAQLRKDRPDLLTRITSDLPLDFAKLPQATRSKLIEQVTEALKKSLAGFLGPFDDRLAVNDYIFSLLAGYSKNLSLQVKSIFGIIVAASVFLLLKSIAAPLRGLIAFAGFLVYKFLIAVNFAHIGLETRNREFIILS